MKTVFTGDLQRFAAPAIGQHVLGILIDEAERAGQTMTRALVVNVGGKTVLANGSYDPKTETLRVHGNL